MGPDKITDLLASMVLISLAFLIVAAMLELLGVWPLSGAIFIR